MPFIQIKTSATLRPEQEKDLLKGLSRIAAETLGKPEQYVMAYINTGTMLMSGQPGPAAFVEVRSIGGITPEINHQLTQKICRLLEQSLGINPGRVFLNFKDVAGTHWGWNGETFGE